MIVIYDNDDDEKWWIDRLVSCRGKRGACYCVLMYVLIHHHFHLLLRL